MAKMVCTKLHFESIRSTGAVDRHHSRIGNNAIEPIAGLHDLVSERANAGERREVNNADVEPSFWNRIPDYRRRRLSFAKRAYSHDNGGAACRQDACGLLPESRRRASDEESLAGKIRSREHLFGSRLAVEPSDLIHGPHPFLALKSGLNVAPWHCGAFNQTQKCVVHDADDAKQDDAGIEVGAAE